MEPLPMDFFACRYWHLRRPASYYRRMRLKYLTMGLIGSVLWRR